MRQSEILSLDEHAGRLLAWLGTLQPVPRFESILVMDTTDPSVEYLAGSGGGWRAPASALRTISEFSHRFDQYLRMGYSWVNLSAYGILGLNLVLGIELPPQGPTGVPVGWTSVNYSGPSLDHQSRNPIWQAPLKISEQ